MRTPDGGGLDRASSPPATVDRCFDAPDLRPVERWIERTARARGLQVRRGEVEQLAESYHDTADRRLLRAGYGLRLTHREDGVEATFESLSDTNGEASRETLRADPLEQLAADEALFGGKLWALRGSQPLSERIDLHSRRSRLHLTGPSPGSLDVALERIDIPLDGDQTPVTLHRVRVVGTSGEAQRLAEQLESACALRPTSTTRFQSAIAAIGVTRPRPVDLGSEIVGRGQLVAETAFAILRRQFRRMVAEEPGTRLGQDIEALHDMRVAIRRQRAAIRLFREYLPPRLVNAGAELRWVGRVLGEVRDLDVQLATLASWKSELEPADRPALEALREWLDGRRTAARRKMVRALETRRYARLLERMTAWLRRGPARRGSAPRMPTLERAPELIARRYGRVIKLGRKIDATSPPETYHRLRIRCKALRYALEFHAELYGKPARRLIDDLIRLQDLLGEHQDADVAMQWLEELVQKRGTRLGPRTAFVTGKLAERYAVRARRLRARFPKRFRGIRGKSWTRLELAMRRAESKAAAVPARRRPVRRASPSPKHPAS